MKFDFKNNNGELLSGRLEMPEGEPKAFALFAHCFTCSKNIVAANTISKSLAEKGIAVLRFDFTGLGNSEGDFANTNFSSNIEDLLSACSALTEQYQSPDLLIGHSLGGAAVLRAAMKLDTVKAVVTLGAPSDVQHLKKHFADQVGDIEQKGEADVVLAGRTFKVKKQFLHDLKDNTILDGIKTFGKALMVMHSPIDSTVDVEHAAKIFLAARHPKSFVSLDNADHLLMKRSDAQYAADVINSWVSRYI